MIDKIRSNSMSDKARKKLKKKRLSKGMRQHIRQLKQEARKEGAVYRSPFIRRAPEKTVGE
jgi:hypothetical protein